MSAVLRHHPEPNTRKTEPHIFLWVWWRTGVYGSILLGMILYLSTLPLGKSSSCIGYNDTCPNHDDRTLECCSEFNLSCMNSTCLSCISHEKGCSYNWQNCCKGLWCGNETDHGGFGRCTNCTGIGDSCDVDGQCCEGLACNESGESGKCVSCIAGSKKCSDQTLLRRFHVFQHHV